MKVYKIEKGTGQYLILDNLREWEDILGGIEYEEVGDQYIITIEDMSESEYNNLDEWGGF